MHEIKAKGILSSQGGINLYRGCTHGCIYCDSRQRLLPDGPRFSGCGSEGQRAESPRGRRCVGKRRPTMVGFGFMSDPYMPLERELRQTRGALELLAAYGFGVAVQTKSDLVMRDLDLLAEIHGNAKAVVQVTLTTYDEALCRILEPHVCTTARRVQVLEACRERGIPTVVWLSPILPFLNDTEENLMGLLRCCAQAGVERIICFGMGLTLREGNRAYFYRQLDRHFPAYPTATGAAMAMPMKCSVPTGQT